MSHANWTIKSIDIMSRTKDTMRGQVSQANMATICTNLASLGATHIAIACPLDEDADYPNPQPTAGYQDNWIAAIRAAGMNVFHRGAWLEFEGIYDEPQATPTGTPSKALGVSATVLNGTDTSSYLYKTWNYIKTHASRFQAGDIWGPCPEPESQGIGAGEEDMFSSYTVMGQWLVDHKTVADDAFENTLGYDEGDIITGMTSINGGTVQEDQINDTYWTQIGRCSIDHYVNINRYASDLVAIQANAEVDLYINEIGPTAGFGGTLADWLRSDYISSLYAAASGNENVKGVNYWQAVSGQDAFENIMNHTTFTLYDSSKVIEKYYKNTGRVKI